MVEPITRRRVVQGAGAVGVAGVLGTTVVTAQENETGGEGDQAALRVAHTSPDAPAVDVRLDDETPIEGLEFREVSNYTEVDPGSYQVQVVPSDGGLLGGVVSDLFGDDEDEDEAVLFDEQVDLEAGMAYTVVAFGEVRRGPVPAEDGTGANETVGNETGTGVDDAGTDTDVGAGTNETGTDAAPDTGAAGNETATGGGVEGGDGTGMGEQVVEGLAFGEHESVDLEARDYILEFREARGTGGETATDGGTAAEPAGGNETAGGEVGNETAGAAGNETAVGGTDAADGPADPGADAERGFQVEVLTDDLTDPGEEQTRLRVFHAVPDVDAVDVTAIDAEDLEAATGNETGEGVDPAAEDGENRSRERKELEPDEGAADDGVVGQDDGEAGAGQDQGDTVRQAEIAPQGQTVYSGFAVGYFDPEAATTDDQEQADANDTGGAAGNDTGVGADGNETAEEDELAETEDPEEFEFVTVEDATEGERADGGTGGFL